MGQAASRASQVTGDSQISSCAGAGRRTGGTIPPARASDSTDTPKEAIPQLAASSAARQHREQNTEQKAAISTVLPSSASGSPSPVSSRAG